MNLNQKLIEIRKELPYLKKSTAGHQYKYVSGSEILYKIQDKMNELGVLLYPELTNCTLERNDFYQQMTNNKGEEYKKFRQERFTVSEGFYVWEDAEKGEVKKVAWVFVGEMDDTSKAIGSGLTYSERYFLMKFFNIPTDEDDPDAFQKKNDPPPPKKKVVAMSKLQQQELMEYVDKLPDEDSLKLHTWLKKGGITRESATKMLNKCRDMVAEKEAPAPNDAIGRIDADLDKKQKAEEKQDEIPF